MKIMLDECITVGPANTLIHFFGLENPPIEAHFVVHYFSKTGLKDCQWADVLAKEGGWSVITADRDAARKSQHKRLVDGPPLHYILPGKQISAVYLSSALAQAHGPEKVRAITSAWPEIKQFFENAAPGARKLLTKMPKGHFVLRDY